MEFLDNGATCSISIVSKMTFSITLKTHTPHYRHMTFRELLISSSGGHGLLDKINTYILKSYTLPYEMLRFKDI